MDDGLIHGSERMEADPDKSLEKTKMTATHENERDIRRYTAVDITWHRCYGCGLRICEYAGSPLGRSIMKHYDDNGNLIGKTMVPLCNDCFDDMKNKV